MSMNLLIIPWGMEPSQLTSFGSVFVLYKDYKDDIVLAS